MFNGLMFKTLIQDAFTFALEIQFKLDFDYMVVYKMIHKADFEGNVNADLNISSKSRLNCIKSFFKCKCFVN